MYGGILKMFENLFQLVKIGKELGLSKKEIRKVLLFDNTKNPTLYTTLMIIALIFSGIIVILIFLMVVSNIFPNGTYPAGAEYSTVKIQDFDRKK